MSANTGHPCRVFPVVEEDTLTQVLHMIVVAIAVNVVCGRTAFLSPAQTTVQGSIVLEQRPARGESTG